MSKPIPEAKWEANADRQMNFIAKLFGAIAFCSLLLVVILVVAFALNETFPLK